MPAPEVPPSVVDQVEEHLRREAALLTEPRDHECLLCFLARALDELGCDTTLRWACRYRDLAAPAATGLERRLGLVGGFCDCEVFMNGYRLARQHCERDVHADELREPDVLPGCEGARHGSTRPCVLWVRQRDWR